MAVRALLVGTDSLARSGLRALLERRSEIELLGEATPEELTASHASQAELLVWDLGPQGATAAPHLRNLRSEVPVLALVPDRRSAADAFNAGAHGILLRDSADSRLAAAAIAVAAGHYVIDASVAGSIFPSASSNSVASEEPLTTRESQVLQLLAQGMANKGIARQLGISEHTAKFHVNAIFSKLGVQSRTEAVIRAAKAGLITL